MTNSIGEIEDAETIFIMGSNTTEAHPVIGYRIRKAVRKGARLIVADPRRIDLAENAHEFLQLKPGTNVALLNGLAHVIIKEGLEDKEFIRTRTENYEELKASVEKYTPEHVETITGVPAENIRQAARLYAGSSSAAIYYTMGITQHTSGVNNVHAIANLAMLTGNLGKAHSGVNPLRGQNNVQGACDMGALPNVFTGYQKVDDPAARSLFEEKWQTKLNDAAGLTATGMIDAAHDGRVRMMYIMGENPVLSDADSKHVVRALSKLDFLVVQDIFLTETAEYADVVLPAASFAEKDGTFVNTERRVQRIRKAVAPPGEARADWQIVMELAQRLGLEGWSYGDAETVFKEMAGVTPSYGGISYERLEKEGGGLQWPCPDASHPGTPILHAGKFTRGAGIFKGVEYAPPAEETDAEYPFILTTGRHLYHYHTGTMTRRGPLEEFRPEERIRINPEDAERLDITGGSPVKIASRRGEITGKAQVTDTVPPGVIFMTFHYKESPVNILTNNKTDPIAGIPELKVAAVKVEKQ